MNAPFVDGPLRDSEARSEEPRSHQGNERGDKSARGYDDRSQEAELS